MKRETEGDEHGLFPGCGTTHRFQSRPLGDEWLQDSEDWITGSATRNPVIREQENHVIIWIQKRRVRIYHQNAKVLDMPTNIYPDVKFNRIRFSGWDRHSAPLVSNIKITRRRPTPSQADHRRETDYLRHHIRCNKSEVKANRSAPLKNIAEVLKEMNR
jgi:hypothetical protein